MLSRYKILGGTKLGDIWKSVYAIKSECKLVGPISPYLGLSRKLDANSCWTLGIVGSLKHMVISTAGSVYITSVV